MIEVKNLRAPDDRREFPHGRLQVWSMSGLSFGVATFEPGWRWSESVKPFAGTETCQIHHNGLCISGQLRVRMDDGTETDIGPGDVFVIPAGHDAWVTGNEDWVAYDFAGGAAEYAKAATR